MAFRPFQGQQQRKIQNIDKKKDEILSACHNRVFDLFYDSHKRPEIINYIQKNPQILKKPESNQSPSSRPQQSKSLLKPLSPQPLQGKQLQDRRKVIPAETEIENYCLQFQFKGVCFQQARKPIGCNKIHNFINQLPIDQFKWFRELENFKDWDYQFQLLDLDNELRQKSPQLKFFAMKEGQELYILQYNCGIGAVYKHPYCIALSFKQFSYFNAHSKYIYYVSQAMKPQKNNKNNNKAFSDKYERVLYQMGFIDVMTRERVKHKFEITRRKVDQSKYISGIIHIKYKEQLVLLSTSFSDDFHLYNCTQGQLDQNFQLLVILKQNIRVAMGKQRPYKIQCLSKLTTTNGQEYIFIGTNIAQVFVVNNKLEVRSFKPDNIQKGQIKEIKAIQRPDLIIMSCLLQYLHQNQGKLKAVVGANIMNPLSPLAIQVRQGQNQDFGKIELIKNFIIIQQRRKKAVLIFKTISLKQRTLHGVVHLHYPLHRIFGLQMKESQMSEHEIFSLFLCEKKPNQSQNEDMNGREQRSGQGYLTMIAFP